MNITFLGAGNMAEGIIKSMVLGNQELSNISFIETNIERSQFIKDTYKVSPYDGSKIDVLIIALKPDVIKNNIEEIKAVVTKDTLVFSIAAGMEKKFFEDHGITNIIRVMPNLCMTVGKGISVFTPLNKDLEEESSFFPKYEYVLGIFRSNSKVFIMDESKFHTITAFSGSGPAFFLKFLDSYIDGGVLLGLSRQEAKSMAISLMDGAVSLLEDESVEPSEIIHSISSPKGTTIHGLVEMEKENFNSAVVAGLKAAYERSKSIND